MSINSRHPAHASPVGRNALDWLGSEGPSASVLATARAYLAAQHIAAQCMPDALASSCRVVRLEAQQLTLAVPSAAHASRLRQLAPRILARLQENGWNLNGLHVKVQASLLHESAQNIAPREARPLDENALQAFDKLHASLRPGPLADAVSQLLAHHRS